MKKILLNVLRVVISLGLLAYLIYLADWQKIISALQKLSLFPFLLAVFTFFVSIGFLTLRWKILNNTYGLYAKFPKLYVFYLIGFFFNNFLPTSIGGDLSRAYYLHKESNNKAASLGIVFFERVLGLMATLSLVGISLFWLTAYFNSSRIIYVTISLILFIAFFLAMIMSRRLYGYFNRIVSRITFYDIGKKILKVFDTLHFYRDKRKVILAAYFCSIMAQFTVIVMNYILAVALNITQVSFGYLVLVVPVTFIFSLLPSINGIGVRDTGYMIFLVRQGVEPATVLSLSFMATIIPVLISIVGGGFFLFYRLRGLRAPVIDEEGLL